MSEPSKYRIAIEAIRTKEDYRQEVWKATSDEVPLGALMPYHGQLEYVIKEFKAMFPGWCWHVGEMGEGDNYARIFNSQVNKIVVHEYWSKDGDFAPSPAKSLLIVMLMALEEMDKREAQS